MLYSALEQALHRAGVLRKLGPSVGVACSGGLDSMVLGHVCRAVLGPKRVVLLHVDHRVRPDSEEDARFVASTAQTWGLTTAKRTLSPPDASEATLRRLRYAALKEMQDEYGLAWVLTAHHAQDQVETWLMGLIRRGVFTAQIHEQNEGVLRPWLNILPDELRGYAIRKGVPWREDSSNTEPRYLRNRVRKELLPLISSRYRTGFVQRLAASISSGEKPEVQEKSVSLEKAQPVVISETTKPQIPQLKWSLKAWDGKLPTDPHRVVFDAEGLSELGIRAFRAGDKMACFGLKGRKNVSDILQEARIPKEFRGFYPLLVDGANRVLWVPKCRRAQWYPIQPTTKRVWEVWAEEV